MFTVNFFDGSTMSEKTHTWDDVPVDKRIAGLQLVLPYGGWFSIDGYSQYFFMNEAVAIPGQNMGGIVAKVFGGIAEIKNVQRCPKCQKKTPIDSNSNGKIEFICMACGEKSPVNLKVVHEFRIELNGNIRMRRYNFNTFRYAMHILRPQLQLILPSVATDIQQASLT